MPEVKTGNVIQQENKQLKARGFAIGTLNDVAAKRTWYRTDGKAIHNLPCDEYHRDRYIAKGWSLTPPPVTDPDQDVAQEAQDDADDYESQEERKPRRGQRVPNPVDSVLDAALTEEEPETDDAPTGDEE